jgi:hypothetical protein
VTSFGVGSPVVVEWGSGVRRALVVTDAVTVASDDGTTTVSYTLKDPRFVNDAGFSIRPRWRHPKPRVSRVWAYGDYRWTVHCGANRRIINDWKAAVEYANCWAQILREDQEAA